MEEGSGAQTPWGKVKRVERNRGIRKYPDVSRRKAMGEE